MHNIVRMATTRDSWRVTTLAELGAVMQHASVLLRYRTHPSTDKLIYQLTCIYRQPPDLLCIASTIASGIRRIEQHRI